MKAITFQGVQNVEVQNVEDPKLIKEDDIIVKVTSTTICGSDLHLIRGKMPKGFIIGHEAMGIVVQARASDSQDNVQPKTAPGNAKGYGNNSIHQVSITMPQILH